MLATTQFHVVPPDHLNFARIPSTTGDLKRTFPDFRRELDFNVKIKAISVLIGVQEDTVHLHRVIESNVSSGGRLILQQTPLRCTIIGASGDRSTRARYVNLVRTLRDDEPSYDKTNTLRQHEDRSSSYHNNNKVCDTGQPLQSSPAFAGSLLTTRRRSLRDALQLYPRPHERTQRAFSSARQCPSVLTHYSSDRQDARSLLSNLELGFPHNKMDEEIRGIEREIKRLHLASQRRRMKSVANDDIEERILSLKQDHARLRLMQGIVEFDRVRLPSPPDGKKK